MADFSMVTARLATGAAINGTDDVNALIAAGVTHVVDERAEFDDGSLLAGSGMTYLWNPVQDDGQPKPPAWHQANVSFAVQAYSVLHSCVYYHCAAGVNRGPSGCYAVLRAVFGFGPAQARQLIVAARPQAHIAYAADFDQWWAQLPS
jgi:hypothetical protein